MNPLEFKKKSVRKTSASPFSSFAHSLTSIFPRNHMLLAVGLSCALVMVTSLPSEPAQASRQAISLPIPQLQESSLEEVKVVLDQHDDHNDAPGSRTIKETAKAGDNLSLIFARAGLSDKDVFALINSSAQAKKLANIFPGHTFTFQLNAQSKLQFLRRDIDHLTSEVFSLTEEGYTYQKHVKTPDVKMTVRSGQISSSLYNAGTDAGLDEQLIMELAGIFGWDIDFALDIRKGDRFKILYEEKFLDGKKIGLGNILAAEFVNQGDSYRAVRYVDPNGKAQYYSPTGKAMQKAFLRAPLDFRRISSNFNPKRLHPITKTVKPHRGTDYAASRGTPVWASGDGRVVASGYTKANGNYIVIQHGSDIQTKYLHLHKRKVKKGARVKQKQIIGTVGSTGMSTAPHLHYEFLLNGVHRNPRTIVKKLPKAKSISEAEMQRFLEQTQPIVARLESTTQMASVNTSTKAL